jgi:hypothetical protein
MCLTTIYRGAKKRAAIAALPETFLVWKLVRRFGTEKPEPLFFRSHTTKLGRLIKHPLSPGWQTARYRGPAIELGYINTPLAGYRAGWHSWPCKDDALAELHQHGKDSLCYRLIECTARRSDITAIGKQADYDVIVTKQLLFRLDDVLRNQP